jgi:hypothetical protein
VGRTGALVRLQADEDCDRIATLFNPDSLRFDPGESASEAKLRVLHGGTFVGTPCQVDHAHPMLADHGFLGIIIETLANDQDRLAVAVALRVWERDIGGERNVSGHLAPKETKLVARVPDVVTSGVDGVLLSVGVVTGAAMLPRSRS